jgi:hypothetical protein
LDGLENTDEDESPPHKRLKQYKIFRFPYFWFFCILTMITKILLNCL